jgi:hypothetical protein
MPNALQIKISILGSKPSIWRRIIVRDDITFATFHEIIQIAMGWENYHLYEFDLGNFRLGIPEEDDFMEMSMDIEDASKIQLSQFIQLEGARLRYTYDFGDNWEHLIEVEQVGPVDEKQKYPFCLKGKGACPPEDCGGAFGYKEFLEAIKDKKHPEHREMLEWAGGKFDPDHFDIDDVNEELKQFQRR